MFWLMAEHIRASVTSIAGVTSGAALALGEGWMRGEESATRPRSAASAKMPSGPGDVVFHAKASKES